MFMQIKHNNHSIIYSEEYQQYPSCKQSLSPLCLTSDFRFPFHRNLQKDQAIRSGENPPQTARFNRNMKKNFPLSKGEKYPFTVNNSVSDRRIPTEAFPDRKYTPSHGRSLCQSHSDRHSRYSVPRHSTAG